MSEELFIMTYDSSIVLDDYSYFIYISEVEMPPPLYRTGVSLESPESWLRLHNAICNCKHNLFRELFIDDVIYILKV